jgi:hypothetical protein
MPFFHKTYLFRQTVQTAVSMLQAPSEAARKNGYISGIVSPAADNLAAPEAQTE